MSAETAFYLRTITKLNNVICVNMARMAIHATINDDNLQFKISVRLSQEVADQRYHVVDEVRHSMKRMLGIIDIKHA